VDSSLPMTVKISQCTGTNKDDLKAIALRSFPKAPTISSFKARQEDEDDDARIDRVLSSKLHNLDVSSRKDLRGVDAQSTMLSDLSRAEIAVSVCLPELVGDLSIVELGVLRDMFGSLSVASGQQGDNYHQSPTAEIEDDAQSKRVAVSLVVESASLALHGEVKDEVPQKSPSSFSYVTKMDRIKVHVLMDDSRLRHTRVMVHELDLFEGEFNDRTHFASASVFCVACCTHTFPSAQNSFESFSRNAISRRPGMLEVTSILFA